MTKPESFTAEVLKRIGCGMTLEEFRQETDHLPPDAILLPVISYGDHANTQQVIPITETIEASTDNLGLTAYSACGVCLLDDDDPEEVDEDAAPIILMKM